VKSAWFSMLQSVQLSQGVFGIPPLVIATVRP
jgi:hypothetical protein